jgi:hypothetical protein
MAAMAWTVLSAIAVVGLLIFWRGPNAVWGGIGLGMIGGFIVATVLFFTGSAFRWPLVGKWVVICSLFGLSLEVLGKILEHSDKAGQDT